MHGGECVGPNQCHCVNGYVGESCQATADSPDVGHCYNDTSCPANPNDVGVYYSQEYCCIHLKGKAFGKSCTPCAEKKDGNS